MTNNILEKDIEAAIHDGQLLMKYGIKIVGRQVRGVEITGLSGDVVFEEIEGVIDLIGYHALSGTWIIIELKRGLADSRAFTQLSRYIDSAEWITSCFGVKRGGRKPKIAGLLIGLDITPDLQFLPCLADFVDTNKFRGYDIDFHIIKNEPIFTLCFSAEVKLEVSI